MIWILIVGAGFLILGCLVAWSVLSSSQSSRPAEHSGTSDPTHFAWIAAASSDSDHNDSSGAGDDASGSDGGSFDSGGGGDSGGGDGGGGSDGGGGGGD